MSPWGITVLVSLAIALFSMLALVYIRGRDRKNYSNCFWKGFFLSFLLTTAVFAILAATGRMRHSLILALPVALAVGSVGGLVLEFIRNRLMHKDFWKRC